MTISTDATTYVVGETINITLGLFTSPEGGPANVAVYIRRHAETAEDKGEVTGAFGTGAKGGVFHEMTATDRGVNDFSAEFHGRTVFAGALRPSTSDPVRTVVVEAAPPSNPAGALVSSHGTTSHTTTVSGAGYDPGTPVSIIVYSAPMVLTTVTTDASGAFSAQITLPSALTGQHTIVAMGTVTTGGVTSVRYLTLDVRLPSLADTGPALATVILAGAGLVAVGLILLLVTYGRRRHGINWPST